MILRSLLVPMVLFLSTSFCSETGSASSPPRMRRGSTDEVGAGWWDLLKPRKPESTELQSDITPPRAAAPHIASSNDERSTCGLHSVNPVSQQKQASPAAALELPSAYFHLMEVGVRQTEGRLGSGPLDLQALDARGNQWRLFPHIVLTAAVLYAKPDPSNQNYQNPEMLSFAIRIGDLLASENERGRFEQRLNSDRDTYMWLEAYRLLEKDLGTERRGRWRQELEKVISTLADDSAVRTDFPGYQSPFIGTSPNHLSLWASTVFLAGRVFNNRSWEELGARIMHRFAAEEQSADGYWGEHEKLLPTPGYDYTTYTGVALYREHSKDPVALEALRRGLDFHKYFTYPDGTPVEVLDDRNRFTQLRGWGQSAPHGSPDLEAPSGGNDESASKGHFGFSNFPDGRRYAEFLTSFFHEGEVGYEDLGRIAQDALYYHPGPKMSIPSDLPTYSRQLTVPAGIRKSGPWVVCLSGLISTKAVDNQYYHDRQGHLSVFNQKVGLIVTGANSKHQPELATFSENLLGQVFYMPVSSRLQMSEPQDRLSLAYNTFFCDLLVSPPSEQQLAFSFYITGHDEPAESANMTLQLCLEPGELLETATGKKILLGAERIDLGAEALGGWIRHHGWTLKIDSSAELAWPVFPHNPYTNSPETILQNAVGALSIPLLLKKGTGRFIRPKEQTINFVLQIN